MAKIKEVPLGIPYYYKSMQAVYTEKRYNAYSAIEQKEEYIIALQKEIKTNYLANPSGYSMNLLTYDEFVQNKYISGKFFKIATGMYLNKENNYLLTANLYNVYKLALEQKNIKELKDKLILYDKLLSLSLKEYRQILKTYFNKVHEMMIVDGKGYAFGHNIGWICINRCKLVNPSPRIDYQATKRKKQEILKSGKRLYNKEEAEWCKARGIEYNAEDGRVFRTNTVCYEIPLLGCTLPKANSLKFVTNNYVGDDLRGKSRQELIELAHNNEREICSLNLDIRIKLDLCLEINKILYSKFIRNEDQKPSTTSKTYS